MELRRLRGNETPAADDWNTLCDMVEQLLSVGGSGDIELSLSRTGLGVTDHRPQGYWAEITDDPAPEGNRYAHVPVQASDTGAVTQQPDFPGRAEGTPDNLPAVEINERGDVAAGTRVWLEPARDGAYFTFDAGGGSAADPIVWVRVTDAAVALTSPDERVGYIGAVLRRDATTKAWEDDPVCFSAGVPNALLVPHGQYPPVGATGDGSPGDTLLAGQRYPARYVGVVEGRRCYEVVADAGANLAEHAGDGSDVYTGGLMSAGPQAMKGEKTWRDLAYWCKGDTDATGVVIDNGSPGKDFPDVPLVRVRKGVFPNRSTSWYGAAGFSVEDYVDGVASTGVFGVQGGKDGSASIGIETAKAAAQISVNSATGLCQVQYGGTVLRNCDEYGYMQTDGVRAQYRYEIGDQASASHAGGTFSLAVVTSVVPDGKGGIEVSGRNLVCVGGICALGDPFP